MSANNIVLGYEGEEARAASSDERVIMLFLYPKHVFAAVTAAPKQLAPPTYSPSICMAGECNEIIVFRKWERKQWRRR